MKGQGQKKRKKMRKILVLKETTMMRKGQMKAVTKDQMRGVMMTQMKIVERIKRNNMLSMMKRRRWCLSRQNTRV